MEAWGIIMIAFTLFGMLALWIGCEQMDERPSAASTAVLDESAPEVGEPEEGSLRFRPGRLAREGSAGWYRWYSQPMRVERSGSYHVTRKSACG